MTWLIRPALPFRIFLPSRFQRVSVTLCEPGPPVGDLPADLPASVQDGRISITAEGVPGTTTVFIRGELDMVTMPVLAEFLARVRHASAGRLVLDLAGTTFMDCASARLLVTAGVSGAARPVVRHPTAMIYRILELTGLDALCEIER